MTLDQVYKNIYTNRFTYVKIFDQRGDLVGSLFDTPKGDRNITPEKLKKYIEEFIKDNPGVYDFFFKKSATSTKNGIIRNNKINCYGSSEIPVTSYLDLDKEREEVRKRIEEEERQKKAQIDYLAKVQELDTLTGMINYIGKTIFSQFMKVPQGNLQGMQQQQHSTEPVAPENFTKEQIELANAGLAKLMKVMSPELFYQIAVKLEANPDKVQVIKTFL